MTASLSTDLRLRGHRRWAFAARRGGQIRRFDMPPSPEFPSFDRSGLATVLFLVLEWN